MDIIVQRLAVLWRDADGEGPAAKRRLRRTAAARAGSVVAADVAGSRAEGQEFLVRVRSFIPRS